MTKSRNRRRLKVAGLFAGIGGLELGFKRAGCETELLCEIDPAAQEVLKRRFPGVPLISDIRSMRQLPANIDVVCAGFPCQDLSSTGYKDGITGKQSSLVGYLLAMLSRRPVEWVVIENVPFMLQLQRGRAMHVIADSLERLGYRWAYRVIDSQGFGLPHRRRRVYFVASLSGDPRNGLLTQDSGAKPPSVPRTGRLVRPVGFYWTEGTYATGLAYDAVPPIKGGSTIGIPSPPAVLFPTGHVGTPHIRDAERLQGFEAGWTEPAEAVSRASARWKLVGNAVTVPVAEWVATCLGAGGRYWADRDEEFESEQPWPEAAWSFGEGRFKSTVSQFPLAPSSGGLQAFLQHPVAPLSERAANGFVSRATRGTLRFPNGFIAAVKAHARGMSQTIC